MVEKVQGDVIGVGKNSNPEKDPVMPVVNSATVKKQSGLKKLWKGFFAEDLKTVRGNVMETVIKPSIKSGIANAVTSAVYMWLFGKNGYTGAPGGIFRPLISGGANTAYSNIIKLQNGQVVNSGAPKVSVGNNANFGNYTSADVYDPEYIRYPSFEDANNVYVGLCERIGKYNFASVKDLYKLSNIDGAYEMVFQNWGWYDIAWHRIVPVGDGTWFLKLPQPNPFNGANRTY